MAGTLCFFTACTPMGIATSYTPLRAVPNELHSVSPQNVEIFLVAPPKRFVEIGVLEVQALRDTQVSSGDLIAVMQKRASAIGCDGLILVGGNDDIASSMRGTHTDRGLRASCIVWDAE